MSILPTVPLSEPPFSVVSRPEEKTHSIRAVLKVTEYVQKMKVLKVTGILQIRSVNLKSGDVSSMCLSDL